MSLELRNDDGDAPTTPLARRSIDETGDLNCETPAKKAKLRDSTRLALDDVLSFLQDTRLTIPSKKFLLTTLDFGELDSARNSKAIQLATIRIARHALAEARHALDLESSRQARKAEKRQTELADYERMRASHQKQVVVLQEQQEATKASLAEAALQWKALREDASRLKSLAADEKDAREQAELHIRTISDTIGLVTLRPLNATADAKPKRKSAHLRPLASSNALSVDRGTNARTEKLQRLFNFLEWDAKDCKAVERAREKALRNATLSKAEQRVLEHAHDRLVDTRKHLRRSLAGRSRVYHQELEVTEEALRNKVEARESMRDTLAILDEKQDTTKTLIDKLESKIETLRNGIEVNLERSQQRELEFASLERAQQQLRER